MAGRSHPLTLHMVSGDPRTAQGRRKRQPGDHNDCGGGGDPSSRKCGSAGKRWWADECLGRSPKNASPGQNRSDPTLTLPLLPFWKTNARLAPPPLHRLSPQSETGPDLRSIWIARKDQNRKKKPNDGNDGVYDPAVHPHLCLAAFFHSGSSVATIRYTANK